MLRMRVELTRSQRLERLRIACVYATQALVHDTILRVWHRSRRTFEFCDAGQRIAYVHGLLCHQSP
jgi:hypothetical protein